MNRHLIPRFLPENYRLAAACEGGPLTAMLAVMETLHEPVEAVIDRLETFVDPYAAPDAFVLLLASWLDLDRYFDWSGGRAGAGTPRFRPGIRQLRLLTAEVARLRRERGTATALVRFLELATGIRGFAIVEGRADGTPAAFHFTVHVPPSAATFQDLIGRIVENERPAHATFDIVYATPGSPRP